MTIFAAVILAFIELACMRDTAGPNRHRLHPLSARFFSLKTAAEQPEQPANPLRPVDEVHLTSHPCRQPLWTRVGESTFAEAAGVRQGLNKETSTWKPATWSGD